MWYLLLFNTSFNPRLGTKLHPFVKIPIGPTNLHCFNRLCSFSLGHGNLYSFLFTFTPHLVQLCKLWKRHPFWLWTLISKALNKINFCGWWWFFWQDFNCLSIARVETAYDTRNSSQLFDLAHLSGIGWNLRPWTHYEKSVITDTCLWKRSSNYVKKKW